MFGSQGHCHLFLNKVDMVPFKCQDLGLRTLKIAVLPS